MEQLVRRPTQLNYINIKEHTKLPSNDANWSDYKYKKLRDIIVFSYFIFGNIINFEPDIRLLNLCLFINWSTFSSYTNVAFLIYNGTITVL